MPENKLPGENVPASLDSNKSFESRLNAAKSILKQINKEIKNHSLRSPKLHRLGKNLIKQLSAVQELDPDYPTYELLPPLPTYMGEFMGFAEYSEKEFGHLGKYNSDCDIFNYLFPKKEYTDLEKEQLYLEYFRYIDNIFGNCGRYIRIQEKVFWGGKNIRRFDSRQMISIPW